MENDPRVGGAERYLVIEDYIRPSCAKPKEAPHHTEFVGMLGDQL